MSDVANTLISPVCRAFTCPVALSTVAIVSFSEVYDNNVTGYDNFKEILNKTEIDVKDWLVGGTFTGYASYQGFSLIKKLIKGQLSRNEF